MQRPLWTMEVIFDNDQTRTKIGTDIFRMWFKLAQSKPLAVSAFFFLFNKKIRDDTVSSLVLIEFLWSQIQTPPAHFSLYSDPATISLPTSSRPTPEMTDRDRSNYPGGHREPVAESLAQQYILPPRDEGHGPEPIVSTSNPPTQGNVLPYYEVGLRPESGVSTRVVTGSEPAPNPPAQQRLYPRSHQAQESAPIMAVQAVDPFPRIPAFQQPVNMIAHESTGRLRLDGSGQDSRWYNSTIGVSDRQQARHPTYDLFSEYRWPGGNTAEASDSSAREPLYIGSQTTAGPEAGYLWNPAAAAQPAMNQYSRHNSPFPTSDAASYGVTVFPPAQTNTAPVLQTSGPYRNQHMRLPPLQEIISLPPLTEFADSTRADQGHSPPRHRWSVILPNPSEDRRLEEQVVGGKLPVLIPELTHPLDPPLKPFDGPRAEAIAQKQWRSVMVGNDRRR